MIHRDIKAGNILLISNGKAKLADFGSSAILVEDNFGQAIPRFTVLGSSYWMAPEISQGSYTHKVDIWSLGITAIEMADGLPPRIENLPGTVVLQTHQLPPPTLKKQEDWSNEFNDFIYLCLTKDPSSRPEAEDLLTHAFISKGDEKYVVQLCRGMIRHNKRGSRDLNSTELDFTRSSDTEDSNNPDDGTTKKKIRIQLKSDHKRINITSKTKTKELLKMCKKDFKDLIEESSNYYIFISYKINDQRTVQQLEENDIPLQIYTEHKKDGRKIKFILESTSESL